MGALSLNGDAIFREGFGPLLADTVRVPWNDLAALENALPAPRSRKEIAMSQVILVTGASSGFGRLTSYALADAGHAVYASMRNIENRNAQQASAAEAYSREHGVRLRALELDVASEASVAKAVETILRAEGHVDVVVHNAGHMSYGPAEAFTPEQFAELYDVNVLSTQRVNRAVLPPMRARGQGLLVWVSSSSTRGGTPPYLSPYFAAKAAMDSLAVSNAAEVARWGIESSIVVPRGVHQRNEPLRARGLARGREALRRVCARSDLGPGGGRTPRAERSGSGRCGSGRGGPGDCRCGRQTLRHASVPRAHRPRARRGRGRERRG